ncbi:MAG: AAA family ATPase, partial [Pseudonocardiaceae bacterium]
MLRSFRLANHLSFRDAHELLLMPSQDNDRNVVPVTAVYGANASGKSNLLDGLQLMSNLVQRWSTREPQGWRTPEPRPIQRTPFRLQSKWLLEPSSFAVELVLGEMRYDYGFKFDDVRIIKEWLHVYPHNQKNVLFERHGASIDFGSTITQDARAEAIKDLLADDTLFLAVAARLNLDQYKPVVDWFHQSLRFVWPHAQYYDERLPLFIEQSASNKDYFLELVRAADIGISDVTVSRYVDDPGADEEA